MYKNFIIMLLLNKIYEKVFLLNKFHYFFFHAMNLKGNHHFIQLQKFLDIQFKHFFYRIIIFYFLNLKKKKILNINIEILS